MQGSTGNLGGISRLAGFTGYDLVRFAFASILFVAAGLKGHQLATSPVVGDSFLDAQWLLICTVEFELFFGLWLVAGLLPRLTRAAALGCFSLFALASLYKALSGAASCGCFGRVEVDPWHTFTFDVVCVVTLLRWRPLGMDFASLVSACQWHCGGDSQDGNVQASRGNDRGAAVWKDELVQAITRRAV